MFQTPKAAVLVDPLLCEEFGHAHALGYRVFPPRVWTTAALPPIDAVILSHEHDDHFDIPSLAKLARTIPIYLSVRSSTAARSILATMGFTVHDLVPGIPVQIGDLEILPFAGDHNGTATGDEWDTLPFLIRSTEGHGSFFSMVDIPITQQHVEWAAARAMRPGLVSWTNNAMDWSHMAGYLAERVEGTQQCLVGMGVGHKIITTIWGTPAGMITCAGGISFDGDKAWLNHRVFCVDTDAVCDQMTKLYRKEKFFSGVPGQTFHMQAGKLKSVDASAPFLATAPRDSWPSRAKQDVAIPDYEPATGRRDGVDLDGYAACRTRRVRRLARRRRSVQEPVLAARARVRRSHPDVRDRGARRRRAPRVRVLDRVVLVRADDEARLRLPRRNRVLGQRSGRRVRRRARPDRADVRPRATLERPARAPDVRHLPRAPSRQPSAAPAGRVSPHVPADLGAGEGHDAVDRGPRVKLALIALVLASCGDNLAAPPDPFCDSWHQWGSSPSHTGQSCVSGQPLEGILADVGIDSLASQEIADTSGELVVHYQTPLVDGDSVYMEVKGGTYTPCIPVTDPMQAPCNQLADYYRFETQVWSEVGFAWQGGALVQQWTFISDWKPPPANETVFHAAIVDDLIAIPAAHGDLVEVDAQTGAFVRRVIPFVEADNTYLVSALAVDHDTVYYTAVHMDHDNPYGVPMTSWLVAVAPDGTVRTADLASLVQGAPRANDATCYADYDYTMVAAPLPPPPNADGTPVLPKQYPCGAQVPGFNAAVGIAFDGTLFVATHAQYNENYSYLTSIDPGDLSSNWSASLRDRLHDGCGVEVPFAADAPPDTVACRDGATVGVDPDTGLAPAGAVDDTSTSSPVPLPNGGVLYGSLTYYNESRGHTMQFDDHGGFVGSYDFGWDLTPAVVSDPTGDRIIVKDNHYGNGVPPEPGPFWITTLDASLHPLWQFQNTEGNSCVRQPDGTLSCTADHPHGFEWCVNAPAVDRDGVVYANSEDGNLYAITANGELRDRLFLNAALGAAYTPLSIDHLGRIYALNNGHMFVVGAANQ